jgi:selenocysteine-specific elongation factor
MPHHVPHHVIVGTAGHIDHGKTSLVKALTGIDADRLEEEKRRGITIDLGFAHVQIGETNFAFIDVPGHEKFVRNMLAGVGGIDMVVLVIAADEGVMPQTREHFDICKLLGIDRGVVALTKVDAASEEQIAIAEEEVRTLVKGSFLDSAPILRVSAVSGVGLEELRRKLAEISSGIATHDIAGITRLPIDRVFTMKGFGTVITGTLIAGTIRKDEELEVHPSGRRARVRSIQVHGAQAGAATAGQRTALNIAGIEKSDLARGMMLTVPPILRSTALIDAEITMLADAPALKSNVRVHLHAYSAETIATIKTLALSDGRKFARLKLDEPLQLVAGDHFILRRFSPVTTIGGGVVIDPLPDLRVKIKSLQSSGSPYADWIRTAEQGLTLTELVARSGRSGEEVQKNVTALIASGKAAKLGEHYFSQQRVAESYAKAEKKLKLFHVEHSLAPGINADEFRSSLRLEPAAFNDLLAGLEQRGVAERDGNLVRLRGSGVKLESKQSEAMQQITKAFAQAGLKVPALPDVLAGLKVPRAEATKIVTLLLRDRTLIKLGDDLVFHRDALAKLKPMLAEYKTKTGKSSIDVAGFKDLAGISRKYAIPLLEHLDRERVTRREGNVRVIL